MRSHRLRIEYKFIGDSILSKEKTYHQMHTTIMPYDNKDTFYNLRIPEDFF